MERMIGIVNVQLDSQEPLVKYQFAIIILVILEQLVFNSQEVVTFAYVHWGNMDISVNIVSFTIS